MASPGAWVATLRDRSAGANWTTGSPKLIFDCGEDSATGEVLAMFADRQVKKIRIIDFKAFTWYAHGREIIREWAEQFVRLSNRRPGEVIEGSSAFTLIPLVKSGRGWPKPGRKPRRSG